MFCYILILLFTCTYAYNTQFTVKHIPLKFLKKATPEKVYDVEGHPSYTIPNWVFKRVFKHNKPNKYKS